MKTVIIDGKEYIEKTKAHDLIYGYRGMNYDKEKLYEAVEEALGFKLFTWQKTFIENATFRCLGATTAEILKMLLNVDGEPLDFTRMPMTKQEDIFRKNLREIEIKLKDAGIPIRKVFWYTQQKRIFEAFKNFNFPTIKPLHNDSLDGLSASIFIIDELHKNREGKKMTGNEYQKLASRTMSDEMSKEEQINHALHGMASEIGELHGIYQKVYQGHKPDEEHKKKELGDLMWFIAEYCTANGWQLEDIMQMNIDKLQARYPDGFSEERSQNRKAGDV